jgi:hypothetical protein
MQGLKYDKKQPQDGHFSNSTVLASEVLNNDKVTGEDATETEGHGTVFGRIEGLQSWRKILIFFG